MLEMELMCKLTVYNDSYSYNIRVLEDNLSFDSGAKTTSLLMMECE